jgi:hypothetical protein
MTPETRQQIEELLRAGRSNRDINRQTGAHRTTIARYRQQLGIPAQRTAADPPACTHGHSYPENKRRAKDGHLYCLACKRLRDRERYVPVQPDDSAIERAVAGDPPDRLSPRERHAAIRRLSRSDYPAAVIAEHVRCSPRTVHRARSRRQAA